MGQHLTLDDLKLAHKLLNDEKLPKVPEDVAKATRDFWYAQSDYREGGCK